jgi:hypothetical protein
MQCRRDRVNDECRDCKSYNKGRLDNGLSLEQAPFFGDAGILPNDRAVNFI